MMRREVTSIVRSGHHVTITTDEGSGCFDVDCTCGELDEETSSLVHANSLAFDHLAASKAMASGARGVRMTPKPNFEGHQPRECGEHRTVGPHRAWCYDCSMWCYPHLEMACHRCRIPMLEAALDDLWGCISKDDIQHLQSETIAIAVANHDLVAHGPTPAPDPGLASE